MPDDETRRLQIEVHDAILAGRLEEARAKLAELVARQQSATLADAEPLAPTETETQPAPTVDRPAEDQPTIGEPAPGEPPGKATAAPRRAGERCLWRKLLLALGGLLLLGCAALLARSGIIEARKTPAEGEAEDRADAAFCQDAVERVQQFRHPGQREPIVRGIASYLARETRPVVVEGWLPPDRVGDYCFVYFRALIGGQPRLYAWRYEPSTGRVEPQDAETRLLSGW